MYQYHLVMQIIISVVTIVFHQLVIDFAAEVRLKDSSFSEIN